ncbi:UbiA-like protein EboC [Flavitalea flava]
MQMNKLIGFLRLMRLANIVTAISDILAGIAITGFFYHYFEGPLHNEISILPVWLLIISTIGLYGGGVVLNDVFDADLDKVERPERPIPSGLIKKSEAALLGVLLLVTGVVAAALVFPNAWFVFFSPVHYFPFTPFLLAIGIAVSAVVYDKWGKHHSFLGPINMGLCRGLNLLLGISIVPMALSQYWMIGLVPVIYIAAITMISKGEVHGGKKTTLYTAVVLYSLVIAAIAYVAFTRGNLLLVLGFLALFALLIFPPLGKAIKEPKGPLIGKAVKAGVIALIVMNAAWAAAFGTVYVALAILLLLPLSLRLAKLFAVT